MVNCVPYKLWMVFICRVKVVLKGLACKTEIKAGGIISIGDSCVLDNRPAPLSKIGPQKVPAGAACTLPPMDLQALHVIADKRKGSVGFDVASLQKRRNDRLCQRLIAKLIQFVPAVFCMVVPLLLVALRGGFRDFLRGISDAD